MTDLITASVSVALVAVALGGVWVWLGRDSRPMSADDQEAIDELKAMNAQHDVPAHEPPAEILACPYPAADPGAVTETITRLAAPEDSSGPAMVPGETPGQAAERGPTETARPEDTTSEIAGPDMLDDLCGGALTGRLLLAEAVRAGLDGPVLDGLDLSDDEIGTLLARADEVLSGAAA